MLIITKYKREFYSFFKILCRVRHTLNDTSVVTDVITPVDNIVNTFVNNIASYNKL